MDLIDKPFRCYSDLPIDVCKQRIQGERWNTDRLRRLNVDTTFFERDEGFAIQINASQIVWRDPTIFFTLEAEVVPYQSHIQVKGHVTMTGYPIRNTIWCLKAGLIAVPFVLLEWSVILWVICIYGFLIGNLIFMARIRNHLIKRLCNLLH